jgi:D-alanine-D-alanine ligase
MDDEYGTEPDVPLQPVARISVVYNLKPQSNPGEPDDKYEEYDPLSTIEAVAAAIAEHGFEVSLCEQDDDLDRRLAEQAPQFVANLAEGRGASRGREAQVPCLLESAGIPFWGSDSASMAVALDKLLTSRLLRGEDIPVPSSECFKPCDDLSGLALLFSGREGARYVVKPRYEGSSKGIFQDSLVRSPTEAEALVRRVWGRYGQPAMVEEYLPGDEITVGLVGNGRPSVVGMMRITPARPCEEFLYSLEEKRNYVERIRYEGPEHIPASVRERVAAFAADAFQALELRDMARVDFRLDSGGTPRVIDINPLPGLSPEYSDLPILNRLSGGDYRGLIRAILRTSFHRNGLLFPCREEE